MRKFILIVIPILLFMTACTQNERYIYATTIDDSTKSSLHQLDEVFLNHDYLYETLAIETDKEVLVAYKVKHLKRFQMKKIEKELKKELKQYVHEKKLVISDDFKIHLEMTKLMKKLEKGDQTTEEINKKIKKIIDLKKEVT